VPEGYVTLRDDCDDARAEVHPGLPEVCDGLDNDCQGGIDDGFNRDWYRDEDGDTYGRDEAPTVACESPGPGYVHVAANTFDCDDTTAEVHPGAVEKCNNRDDNCVGGDDEPFLTGTQRKGAACTNDICSGSYVCDAAQTGTVCDAPAPLVHYPDVDGDGEGSANALAQKSCVLTSPPPGRVTNASDCDDLDPRSQQSATEVCDDVDNDCDRQVDEGLSCGGTLKQVVDVRLGGSGHDWRAVAMGPGGYPVWVAGLGGKLAVRKTVGGPFQSFDGDQPNSCATPTDWLAAWVRPSDGSVFLAGANGRLAWHSGSSCVLQTTTPVVQTLTGIIGFESDGVTTLYVTGMGGYLYRWVPGTTPVSRFEAEGFEFYGVAGPRPEELYIAGRVKGGTSDAQRLLSYTSTGSGAVVDYYATGGGLEMTAICMGAGETVHAVGFGSHAWKRTASTHWSRMPRTNQPSDYYYTGVAALPTGPGDAYVVTKDTSDNTGSMRRVTPYGWAARPSLDAPVQLHGIAISSVGNFWVVGNDGYVAHYPEP
jgi:hypothetical protein